MNIWLLLLTGFLTGTLAGLLGIGGGLIFSPVFLYYFEQQGFENPHLWAVGTSLFCTFVTACGSSIRQWQQQNLNLKHATLIGWFAIIGIAISRVYTESVYYNPTVFRALFLVLLSYAVYSFFSNRNVESTVKELNTKQFALTGIMGGIIATVAGVGGGIVMVPMLSVLYGLDLKKSVGLSSAAIVWIAVFGFISYTFENVVALDGGFNIGYVHLTLAAPVGIAAFIGGFVGVNLGKSLSETLTKWIFSALCVSLIAFTLYRMI